MICRGVCQSEIDDAAPFCPICGADPLLGEPWAKTLGLDAGQDAPDMPEPEDLERWSSERLVLPILWSAYLVQSAEAHGVELWVRGNRMTWLGRRFRVRKLRREGSEAYEFVASAAAAFRALGSEAMSRCARAGGSPDDFAERYPQLAWACFREYACYGYADTQAELYDAFLRRINLRLARVGGDLTESWTPEDEAYRIRYNSLLFAPAPGDGVSRMEGMENVDSGPDSPDGMLQLALTPAAWRHWGDVVIAPSSMVLVFEQTSLLDVGLRETAGADEVLSNEARRRAATLEDKYDAPVTWQTLEVTNMPAVACDLQHEWHDGGLLMQRYLWVYAPECVYFLRGWAPAAAPEYVRAVSAALEGFEVAA